MKVKRAFLLLTYFFLTSIVLCAQEEYETGIVDPMSNRLISMSTGNTAPAKRFYINLQLPIGLQIGYVPISKVQISASAFIFYRSVGIKTQLLENSGIVSGISLSLDYLRVPSYTGAGNVTSGNISASFGNDSSQYHLNIVQPFDFDDLSTFPFPTVIQAGFERTLHSHNTKGTKFIGEVWFVNKYQTEYWGLKSENFGLAAILVGIRRYDKIYTWELHGGFISTPWIPGIYAIKRVSPYFGVSFIWSF